MDKPTLGGYIKERTDIERHKISPGPFITISRQFACSGEEVAVMLVEKLNEIEKEQKWKTYGREILHKLAEHSRFSIEDIEKARTEKTSFIRDILKNVCKDVAPDSYEVCSQIAIMLRQIATEGHAVILGQGGGAATHDIENGLNVRIEAPFNWRVEIVCRREKITKTLAIKRIKEIDRMREHLLERYSQLNPRSPEFHLLIDSSKFTVEQCVEQILLASKQLGFVKIKAPELDII